MEEGLAKGVVALILASVCAYFQELLGPLVVLFAVMLADYITGMGRAWVRKELSSRTGLLGLVKKIACLFGVAVAIVADWVIQTAAEKAGMDLGSFYMFGLLVTVWMILNECISILENISDIGVPLPGFLVALIGKLKKTTEERGDDAANTTGTRPGGTE